MDVRRHNSEAWDEEVRAGNPATVPVGAETIAAARAGRWQISVTLARPVPAAWLPEMSRTRVLCLAAGGGQQGPVLAAAGARVVVFDASALQLEQDRLVARRDGLTLSVVRGDMRELACFRAAAFDLIVHPLSNQFLPEIRGVWREAFRLLRPGGALVAGFMNPVSYAFDPGLLREGVLQVRHDLPYSDLTSITEEERRRSVGEHEPLEFGHTLSDQIGGQIAAGFVIAGFYEDTAPDNPVGRRMPLCCATLAIKPAQAAVRPPEVE